MKHLRTLALTVLGLFCLAGLGQAQQPGQNPAAFKATLTGPLPDLFDIPVNPPGSAVKETGTGQADLLGPFQWVGHLIQHGGPDFRDNVDFNQRKFTRSVEGTLSVPAPK